MLVGSVPQYLKTQSLSQIRYRLSHNFNAELSRSLLTPLNSSVLLIATKHIMCTLSRNVTILFTLYNTSFLLTWEDGINRIYLALLEIWNFMELFYLIGFGWFWVLFFGFCCGFFLGGGL